MLDLKQYFEKIYLISCYHTKDRLDVTIPHLKENGIEPDIIVEMKPRNELDKKEGKKEEPEEKSRLRRFLREKDLKKHLK